MSKKYTQKTLFFFVLILISSCSTVQIAKNQDQISHTSSNNLNKSSGFQLFGKLGFKSSSKAGSATINWLQQLNMYTITISGPLGSNRAILKGNELHAEMQIQGQNIYGSPQDLSSELLGASLPFGLMRFWVMGMPAPNYSFTKNTFYKNSESYSSFFQLDWQLDFYQYKFFDTMYLPTRIQGSKQDHSFTLIIKDWRNIPNEKISSNG